MLAIFDVTPVPNMVCKGRLKQEPFAPVIRTEHEKKRLETNGSGVRQSFRNRRLLKRSVLISRMVLFEMGCSKGRSEEVRTLALDQES